ncbi:hypothetical protein QBC46DRAFT_450541 [Diplogelasinospora grovesii]|uniref:P-loop containing nucleoside triphosphate hydrolase protein n=1 Tax=Diplogelasinospora grovesii TaxID=303347 RepID=A0AAN6N5R4_9PEZI|nr:hypothetical protein QBC46DRAFT_450541 [Diplogelasinospora grovesii]
MSIKSNGQSNGHAAAAAPRPQQVPSSSSSRKKISITPSSSISLPFPLPTNAIHISLDSWFWRFLEWAYRMPNPPPPRQRTRPMEVICVGLPRSGTESLQQALMMLGYDYTYHGWDIVYDRDDECHSPGWVRLARKKWYGGGSPSDRHHNNPNPDPNPHPHPTITTADFDELLGHAVAVTDAAASCFAAELIAAYPDAKVVLNMRRDVDAWHRSVINTLVHANESWGFWLASFLDRECFWAWHVYERFLWPLLFRAPDGDMNRAIRRNARWVAREHCDMIRGLVTPKDRLLEWYIEDGWAPLCEFLGKPVPPDATEFPHANAAGGGGGGWKAREEQCNKRWVEAAFVRLGGIIIVVCVILLGIVVARFWRM